jgi:low temperature requirement protein LtrA
LTPKREARMANGRRQFAATLGPRDRHEPHRSATPLELFFDLVTVLAVAAAAAGLHHALAEGHPVEGVIGFGFAFFAIWWAWMNYTWFASAYDNGDTLFRLLTLLIMAGSLILATGIPAFFEGGTLWLAVSGYIVMRLAMVTLWLRAAAGDPSRRAVNRRYAVGIAAVQVYWCLAFFASIESGWFRVLFLIGVALELSVPLWAERVGATPWHRHHIVERYELMNIIVLGETLLAAVLAIRAAIAGGGLGLDLGVVATAATVTAFGMWWLYFTDDEQLDSEANNRAFVWGYGHFLIFAAGASAGAGFAVQVDMLTEHAHLTEKTADLAVAIPVAIYLFGLWLVRDRYCLRGAARSVLLVGALLALATPLLPHSIVALATLIVGCIVVRGELSCRMIAADAGPRS